MKFKQIGLLVVSAFLCALFHLKAGFIYAVKKLNAIRLCEPVVAFSTLFWFGQLHAQSCTPPDPIASDLSYSISSGGNIVGNPGGIYTISGSTASTYTYTGTASSATTFNITGTNKIVNLNFSTSYDVVVNDSNANNVINMNFGNVGGYVTVILGQNKATGSTFNFNFSSGKVLIDDNNNGGNSYSTANTYNFMQSLDFVNQDDQGRNFQLSSKYTHFTIGSNGSVVAPALNLSINTGDIFTNYGGFSVNSITATNTGYIVNESTYGAEIFVQGTADYTGTNTFLYMYGGLFQDSLLKTTGSGTPAICSQNDALIRTQYFINSASSNPVIAVAYANFTCLNVTKTMTNSAQEIFNYTTSTLYGCLAQSSTSGLNLGTTTVATNCSNSCLFILPVKLGSFAAAQKGSNIYLSWTTLSETTQIFLRLKSRQAMPILKKLVL